MSREKLNRENGKKFGRKKERKRKTGLKGRRRKMKS